MTWMRDSACGGMSVGESEDIFFPGLGAKPNRCRKFCASCPVQLNCLDFAIDGDYEGFWAGTTYEERKQMRKFRNGIRKKLAVEEFLPSIEFDSKGEKYVEQPEFVDDWLDTYEPNDATIAAWEDALQREDIKAKVFG